MVSLAARACRLFLPPSQTQEEKETAAQHAAAVTIQSRMRTHLRTKASTTAQDTATATTATTTKKSAAGPAAGGSSGQQGGAPPTSSLGKESTHPSTVTSAPGGASATAHGGATARGAGGETSEDETGISRATRQIQVRTECEPCRTSRDT